MDRVPRHSSSAPAHLPNKMTTTKWAIGVATLLSPVSTGSHMTSDGVESCLEGTVSNCRSAESTPITTQFMTMELLSILKRIWAFCPNRICPRKGMLVEYEGEPHLPSSPRTFSSVISLSVLCLYRARSSAGLARYEVGLRLVLASTSSPLFSCSRPGATLSCALLIACNKTMQMPHNS